MARDLKLQVLLNAVDNATAPLKKISRGSEKTAQALKASRDELKTLEAAQKDLRGFRQLKQGSEKTATALGEQQRKVAQLTREIKNTSGPTKQLNRQRDAAIRQARKLKDQYQGEQQQLQRLRRGMSRVEGVTGTYSEQQRELARRVQTANRQLEAQQRQLSETARRQRAAAEAARRYQRATVRGRQLAGSGAGMAASGGAALYAGARLLAPGVEYGEQMSAVQAVGRFEDDDKRLAALKAQSRELGASTAFSATDVGAGQEFLLRAGVSAEAIGTSLRDVLDLAIANNTELGRTADIASNIAGTFKIDLEQDGAMTRVADVLSATASRANVDLEKLGDTVKYLGGAEDLNLTLEQASAMAGMLGNVGIQGSQAGTALRAMMNRLTNPARKGAASIAELGLQVSDADGNMRAMPDILRDLNAATQDLGNTERKAALQKIFGAEAGSGMAELVSQMSTGALDELIEKLQIANGENAKMASVRSENLGGDLKALSSAWQEVGITLTDTNNGPLRDLIQNITAVTRAVGSWMKDNPELTATLAKAAAAVAAVVAVGGTLLIFLGSILGPIAAVRYALTLLSLNPVSLTIMAIVAAVAALAGIAYVVYRNWDKISEWFSQRWADVKAAFSGGIGGITRLLLDWSPLGLLWRGISEALAKLGVDIPKSFSGMGGWVIDGIKNGITGKLGELKKTVTDMASNVGGWFKDKLGIKSPSRVFASFGGYTVDGLNQGLDAQRDEPARRIRDIAKRVATAGAGMAIGTAAVAGPAAPAIDQAGQLQIDRRPAISAAPASSGGNVHITMGDINVQAAPGMDEQALARYVAQEVQRALRDAEQRSQARRLSSMRDID